MDEHIQELFDMYHNGEIDVWDLADQLETERFDGDLLDYL